MILTQMPTASIAEKKQSGSGWMMLAFPMPSEEEGFSLVYQEMIAHEPSAEEIAAFKTKCLNAVKQELIRSIERYDASANVNSSTLNGMTAWLDKATRVGLVNSVNMSIKNGDNTITLWLADYSFTLPCETALSLLESLELYAMKCYNKTAEHKAAVLHESDMEVLRSYDFTAGYPDKLNINI